MTRVARRLGLLALMFAHAAIAQPATSAPASVGEMRLGANSMDTGSRAPEAIRSDVSLAGTRSAAVRFTDRPLTLNVLLGVGTPVGGFGGVVEYSFTSRIAVGAGAGATWLDADRKSVIPGLFQLAALARYRLALVEGVDNAQGFDLVGAFASGRFIYPVLPAGDASSVNERAYWVQVALEYELMTRSGFRFATGPGIAYLAGTSDVRDNYSDVGPLAHSNLPRWFASFDLTFGFGI